MRVSRLLVGSLLIVLGRETTLDYGDQRNLILPMSRPTIMNTTFYAEYKSFGGCCIPIRECL